MADVFVSYKREDATKVRKLVHALRADGLDVWWDEDIPPSVPWETTIEKALADAKSVIVCWSPASVTSENVRSEARQAREDGRLIQVFVSPCSAPFFFGERQGVDLRAAGQGAEGDAILRRTEPIVLGYLKNGPPTAYLLSDLAYLRAADGRADEAVNLLDRAVSAGWLPQEPVDLAQEPCFLPLVGRDDFQAVRQRILSRIAEERRKVSPVMLATSGLGSKLAA